MPQKHLTQLQVLDYLEGKLSPPAHASVEIHLAGGCKSCNELHSWWVEALHDIVAAGTSTVSAPAQAILQAKAIFTTARPRQVAAPRKVFTASMIFDSRLRPAMVGVRGAAASIQQVYRTEDHFVELGMERQPAGKWSLIGVMIPPESSSSLVIDRAVLIEKSGTITAVNWNSLEFYVADIAPGHYELRLEFDSCTVQVQNVQVGDNL